MKQSVEDYRRSRSLLLDAAETLFAENGFSQTTVEEITEQANYSKGSFYTYFPSKTAILLAIIDEKLSSYLEGIEFIAETESSLEGTLSGLFEYHITLLQENASFFRLISAERYRLGAKISAELRTRILAANQKYQSLIQSMLDHYRQSLRDDVSTGDMSVVLRGVISSFLTECAVLELHDGIIEKAPELVSIYLNGVKKKESHTTNRTEIC